MNPFFLKRIQPIIDAWGAKSFPVVVIERMEKRTGDLTESEMSQLCNMLIDNCERAPNVHKIVEYAQVVRGRRRIEQEERKADKPDCSHCFDMGVIQAISLYPEQDSTLVRCTCRSGSEQDWRLPQWIHEFGALYKKESCPLDWFAPSKGDLITETNKKRDAWRERLKIAEKFWMAAIPSLKAGG
jgi:hypothetical protein